MNITTFVSYRKEHQNGRFFSMVKTDKADPQNPVSWAEAWDVQGHTVYITETFVGLYGDEKAHQRICEVMSTWS